MPNVRKLAAIVFTDIVDFTSLMEKNESKALRVLRSKRAVIESELNIHNGQHLKEMGDGDLMMFDSATSAVDFVLSLHNKINTENLFTIRAAVHLGDVVVENDDVFGSGVNIASRLHVAAKPGQTVLSESIYMQIKNKPHFNIKKLGEKSFKGIDQNISVYILSDNIEDEVKEKVVKESFLQNLLSRRVPQFIGLYFAISWGVIQFVNWVVDRYMLSPYLIDLSFAISMSMIPSILILSYFHGRPGKDQWTKVEKVAVPLNFIVSAIVLFILFYPKDLGAVTKEVKIVDEDGNEFIKTVIKTNFKKNLIIFPFNNINDDKYNWLLFGMSGSISSDLSQDLYVVDHTESAVDILIKSGQSIYDTVPLREKKSISNRTHASFFTAGEYEVKDDKLFIYINLYDASNVKKIFNKEYSCILSKNNYFKLIDQISFDIRRNMNIPETYLDTAQDLPVEEILTDSFDSYTYFSRGLEQWKFKNNNELAEKYFDKAFEFDPKFAFAHLTVSIFQILNGNSEKREYHLKQANKYSSKLTEVNNYIVKLGMLDDGKPGSHEKKKKIVNMWQKQYPEDKIVYSILTKLAYMDNDIEKMIFWNKKQLEINPSEHDILLDIGNIYKDIYANFKEALKYYNQYLEIYPNSTRVHETIARLYMSMHNYNLADEHFLNAEMLGSKGINFKSKYLQNTGYLNNWNLSEFINEYEKLLSISETASDSLTIVENISNFMVSFGNIRQAITLKKSYEELLVKTHGPVMAFFDAFLYMDYYILLGEDEKAFSLIKEAELLPSPLSLFKHSLERHYYYNSNDIAGLKSVLETSIQAEYNQGIKMFKYEHDYSYGKIYEYEGDLDKAIEYYTMSVNDNSTADNIEGYLGLAKCYILAEDISSAENTFQKIFDMAGANSAELNYEYAVFLENQGKIEKSKKYIKKAYEKYKNADPELELTKNIIKKYNNINI